MKEAPTDNQELALLVEQLDFSDLSLNTAVLQQGGLMRRAAKYYVGKMRMRLAAEAAYEERQAFLGLKFRRDDRAAKKGVKPRPKEMTETELKELVAVQQSVRDLRSAFHDAKEQEAYAKMLFECYEWRGYSCQILAKTVDEEARGDLRVFVQQRAKKKLQEAIRNKYAGGAGDERT